MNTSVSDVYLDSTDLSDSPGDMGRYYRAGVDSLPTVTHPSVVLDAATSQ